MQSHFLCVGYISKQETHWLLRIETGDIRYINS